MREDLPVRRPRRAMALVDGPTDPGGRRLGKLKAS